MLIKNHLDMLEFEVKDKASEFKGVVVSMSFDLFGCIQADVRPKELDEKGELRRGLWLDVSRLIITSKKPVMEQPNFEWGPIAQGKKGPADLPNKI